MAKRYRKMQRWSRGHKARGQGQPFRGQTPSRPRTGMLEAKDTGASGLQKKKDLQNVFSGDLQKRKTKKVFANYPRGFWRFPA